MLLRWYLYLFESQYLWKIRKSINLPAWLIFFIYIIIFNLISAIFILPLSFFMSLLHSIYFIVNLKVYTIYFSTFYLWLALLFYMRNFAYIGIVMPFFPRQFYFLHSRRTDSSYCKHKSSKTKLKQKWSINTLVARAYVRLMRRIYYCLYICEYTGSLIWPK